MTLRAAELAFNLWAIGLPVVIITGSLLRLLHRAPARARYLLVVTAFLVASTLPFASEKEEVLVNATAPIAQETSRLPLVWPAIAVLLWLRDAIGHLRLRRLRRTWQPAADDLKALLQWPSIPLAIDGNAPPMTTGLVAPRVVLPANIANAFPLDVARRIARHELAHRTWRDPLVFAAMRAVASLLWLAPLWPLLRWARREREAAADEAALRTASHERDDYVAALLALAKNPLRRTLALPMAGSDLQFRARRIFGLRQSPISIVMAIATLFAGIVFAKKIEPMALALRNEPAAIIAATTQPSAPEPQGLSSPITRQPGTPATSRRGNSRSEAAPLSIPILDTHTTTSLAAAEPPLQPRAPEPTQPQPQLQPQESPHVHVARHVTDDDRRIVFRNVIRN